MDIVKEAMKWRKKYELIGKGGVIVFFDGELNGWVDCLRDPHHWRVGVIAIDEAGNRFVTVGGDEMNGAKAWVETKG